MNKQIVYKVVRKMQGRVFSANARESDIAHYMDGDTVHAVVEYKIGEVTKPSLKGSKLFAFDNIFNARHWCGGVLTGRNKDNFILLECNASGVQGYDYDYESVPGYASEFMGFWVRYNSKSGDSTFWYLPIGLGVLLAESITPIRIVDLEKEK
jgi:hypothetical protein